MQQAKGVPILIVDDNAGKRLALKSALAHLDYDIVEAESGTEALRRLLVRDFAVILLDVQMPVMDGFETAALIRQRQQSQMTPIIFITSHRSDEIRQGDLYAEGAVDFIFAPVPPHELRSKVAVFAGLFRRAAELASDALDVRQTLEDFRALTDATPIGIFRTDADERYTYTNPAWSEITGILGRDIRGQPCVGLVDSDEQLVYDRVYDLVHPAKGACTVQVTTRRVVDETGATTGWVGTMSDITAERREQEIEAALRQAEGRYRQIVETTMEAMIITDPEGRVTYANEAVETMLETTADRFVGSLLIDAFPADVQPLIAGRRDARQEGALMSGRIETEMQTTSGKRVPVLKAVSSILDEAGNNDGSLVMIIDMTESVEQERRRVELEEQLQQSQRLESIGQLAGGIAHDFNNLLLVMCGYGELALQRIDRGEPVDADDIKDMLFAGERATQLTRQLLAFGRRQILHPEVIDLGHLVKGLERLLRQLIGDSVELVLELPAAPANVKVDRVQMEQVLANLTANARDAMPQGGRLTIAIAPSDDVDEVVLSVSDNGSGMDADTATRAFEPFFTTKGKAGTGFGLSTVHGIVSQSGGRIAVDTTPGVGTTFAISLPITSEAARTKSIGPGDAAGGNDTILLVEDDPAVRGLVAMMLKTLGYVVLQASDGEAACEVAGAHGSEIDLLLSDLLMPGLSGRDTAAAVLEIVPDTKVLLMSGYTDDVVVRDGGVDAEVSFIQKPFTVQELARSIRGVLDVSVEPVGAS